MRKLKLFLSLLMLMAFSLGNVWGADSGLTASDGVFIIDFYDSNKLTSTSGTGLTKDNYSGFVKVTTGLTATDVVTGVSVTGTVQYGKNGGLTAGTSSNTAPDANYVSFSIGSDYAVKKVTVYATLYDSGRWKLNGSLPDQGELAVKGSQFSSVTKPLIWDNLENVTNLTFKKESTSGGNCKRVTIYTIVCEYETAAAKPSVSIDPAITGGELSITGAEDLSAVDPETELTITATPGEGYKLPATITFKDGDEQTIDPDDLTFVENDDKNGGEFLMPDYDITVSATFTAKAQSAVTVTNPAHGTITVSGAANLSSVMEGTVLTVDVEGSGYTFTPKAFGTESNEVVAIVDGKLTMPAFPITITADETEITTPTITLSEEILNFGEVAKGAAVPAAKTFTIDGVHLTGDLALAWDVEGDDAFTYEFTAGSLTATDGAVSATVTVTPKSTATAGSFANTLTVSGGGATAKEVLVGFDVLETYTATWSVNGTEVKTQTAVAGTELSFPANPEATGDCAELFFQGWAEAAIATKQDAALAYTELTAMPAADVNFYAVFATKGVETVPGDPEWVATAYADLATNDVVVITSKVGEKVYALSNDNGTGSAPTASEVAVANSKLSAAPATTLQWDVTKDGDNATFYVHGSTTSWLYATNANNGVRVGENSSNAFSIKDDYLYHNGQSRYLGVYNSSDWRCYTSINTNISGQTLAFYKQVAGTKEVEVYTDFLTTCPSCASVALTKGATENGAFTLKVNGVETASVKTCEGATIDVEFAPAEGYTLDAFTVSGVENATYADGQITIPVDATGTLVATATFKAINYTVTMAQTGGADATISADQIDKHYGDEITVSAEDKDGFVFLNWEATPAVEFANAKALETTFAMPANDVTVTANFAKILTVAEAVALIDAEGTIENQVIEGYVSKLYSSSVSAGGQISYYIQDIDENGFLTGIEFEAYNGKGMNGAAFAEITDVKVGAKVRLYGKLKKFKETYEFDANNYQLIYTEAANPSVVVYGEADYKAYYYNEDFLFDGLSAKKAYDNGYAEAIAAPQWKASPAKITESCNVAVTATYETLTSAPFNVAVTKQLRELTDEQLAWSAAEAKAYTVGKAYTLPTLTNKLGLAVTYTSETPETATISNEEGHEGEISIVAAGSTVITASFAGNDEYAAKEVSYTLTVVAPASVVITGEASNTAYEYGYNFSFEGLGAKAVYTNEDEYEISAAEITWAATPATVTMDNNVSVKATWEGIESAAELVAVTVKKHKVTIVQPDHGTLVVKYSKDGTPVTSGAELVLGTQLIFEIIPESSDYKAGKVLVNNKPIDEMEGTIGKIDYEFSAQIFEKAEAGIEWSTTYGEIQVQGTEIVNSDLPSLTNPYELTITYSSDDTNVAEIDPETGLITPKADGYTTISATFAGNEDYKAAQVSFNLTVEEVAQPEFYLIGSFNGWNEFVPVYDTWYEFENLTPGDYKLKVTTTPNWSEAYGYDALTVKHAGLSKDNDGNICFTISNESSIVIVDFEKDEEGVKTFTVTGGYVKPTFTVVGVDALVGYNWGDGLNAYENEMVEDPSTGNYELVKENVLLAAGDYEYQVAMNHDWRGVSNSTLAIAESGIYTVTFTYVPSTGKTSAEAQLIEPIVILPTMKIAGDWDKADENKWNENALIVAGDEKTASYTATNLVSGTWYHFWIIKNGVYMSGNKGFDRENLSADLTNYSTGDGSFAMYFQADQDGDYTFTWTYDTNVITMTFPYKEATALDNTEAGETAVKVMQNGQLLIIKNGKTYNAQGQIIK